MFSQERRSLFERLVRSPLFWILLVAALLRVPGLFWGMPAADGWDIDGVAPRKFLEGLTKTYAPGNYSTYPPLHMFILALLTWPGWVLGLLNAHSLGQQAVIAEMTRVPYMTFFAVTARLVSAAMSLATIVVVARMTELVGGKRAGLFAAAACAMNAGFAFYSQVSNLDVPYIFWSALSLLAWMRLIAEHDLKQLQYGALAAAAAIATKDQAYAIFALSIPAALALWFALDNWPRRNIRALAAELLKWSGISLLLLLLIDGAITNPIGFANRLAYLTGPASADFTEYAKDWAGRRLLLADMGAFFTRYYPAAFSGLAGLGFALCAAKVRRNAPASIAALVPILAAVSCTLAFNFVAMRAGIRFVLPQSLFIAVYAGLAADALVSLPQRPLRIASQLLLPVLFGAGIYACGGVASALVNDPRYDAERWLEAHARGATIETYGLNQYLPRFPAASRVARIHDLPRWRRNPLPWVTEVQQPFEALPSRHPRYIVVSGFWVVRYLGTSLPGEDRFPHPLDRSDPAQARAQDYFRALFAGKLGYRIVHRSANDPVIWPAIHGYASVVQTVFIFERT